MKTNLLRCPNCGWWGTYGDLDFDPVSDLFEGVGACPECDTIEGLLKPYDPDQSNER